MRKLLSFLAVLGTLSYQSMAAFSPVTHTSGTVTVSGVAVTVASTGTSVPPTTSYCGSGPYFIGPITDGGYQYTFTTASPGVLGATHIRMNITDFQSDDTIEVFVNGAPIRLTSAVLSAFAGTCANGFTASITGGAVKNRIVNTTPTGAGGATIVFSSTPGYISTLDVVHNRRNANSNGVVYSLEFDIDTCNQELVASVDSPYCSTRELYLRASDFPNATFDWKHINGTTPSTWTSNLREPVIPSAVFTGNKDYYIVTATRGACSYTDTAAIDVELTPSASISMKGPKCTGDEDTVTVNASIGLGGEIWIIKPNGTKVKPNLPPTFNYIRLPDIQTTDAGIYRGYAIGNTGCVSDTVQVTVSLNPVVEANFTFDQLLGCDDDSIKFNDLSLGNNTWRWEFGDGNTINGTDPTIYQNPLHIYSSQGTYDVELYVTNNLCADSMTRTIIISRMISPSSSISGT